jgi:hypothetical protein
LEADGGNSFVTDGRDGLTAATLDDEFFSEVGTEGDGIGELDDDFGGNAESTTFGAGSFERATEFVSAGSDVFSSVAVGI